MKFQMFHANWDRISNRTFITRTFINRTFINRSISQHKIHSVRIQLYFVGKLFTCVRLFHVNISALVASPGVCISKLMEQFRFWPKYCRCCSAIAPRRDARAPAATAAAAAAVDVLRFVCLQMSFVLISFSDCYYNYRLWLFHSRVFGDPRIFF